MGTSTAASSREKYPVNTGVTKGAELGNESRGTELKDSRRRPRMEPCSSGIGWPRLLGVLPGKVVTVTVGPSLGQSVQSVLESRWAISAPRRLWVGPRAANIWPRGHSCCRKSGEGHTFRALQFRGCGILWDMSHSVSRVLEFLGQITGHFTCAAVCQGATYYLGRARGRGEVAV